MSIIIAIGHIVGAIIVLVAVGFGIIMIAGWENERNHKSALSEMSLSLGIPINELDNAEHHSKVIHYLATRFSSELLRNRLSDLSGSIQKGWRWLGILLQAGIFLGVIWFTITDDLSNSIHAWWIIAVELFFWISAVLFAQVCKLLTGRFPGQAGRGRKMLADAIEQPRSASVTD